MDAYTSRSTGDLHRDGRIPTSGNPFSAQLDTELLSIIAKLEELYREGKRTFVIVTHRDPDADAIAGCLGMERLIRGILPSDVMIKWMHDGELCASLAKTCGRVTESITHLPSVIEASPEGSVAVVVVDQPGLHSCAVLPPAMRYGSQLGNREADIILDHHGEERYQHGAIALPESGCTAALIYRLLQLAREHEGFKSSISSSEDEARFALLVNVGARTDAGQNIFGTLAESVSPFVAWAVRSTEGKFPSSDAQAFDVLASQRADLLDSAKRDAHIYHGVEIDGVPTHLVVAYAGVAESTHCIGACASKMFDFERERARVECGGLPVAVVVCGIIRPESKLDAEVVHAGERVQISIRTEPAIDAELIAAEISSGGGGRVGAAAAQLTVPKRYDSVTDELFVERLIELLEVKLTWPEKYNWKLDARS